jgi:DNA polymerase-3 subunit epsilon
MNRGLDVRPLRDHPRCVCTMMESAPILRLRAAAAAGRRRLGGGYKWPKLSECVAFYGLPVDPAGLHDARQDVLATSLVYAALRKNAA